MYKKYERIFQGVILLLVALWAVSVSAQTTPPEPDAKASVDELRGVFSTLVNTVQIHGGPQGDQVLQLHAKPLLNWSNPERKTTAGGMFLWTRQGRPELAMCLYPAANRQFDMEFQSLALTPLVATIDGQPVWHPRAAGIEMRSLQQVTGVAATPSGRLLQMRRISREFTAKLVPPERTEIPLRLLATPLYRYPQSPDSSTTKLYVDGAMFAFVQATDPEVMLLIEAVETAPGKMQWQYGVARMSMVPTEVRQGDELVWETQWAVQDDTTPYRVIKR